MRKVDDELDTCAGDSSAKTVNAVLMILNRLSAVTQ